MTTGLAEIALARISGRVSGANFLFLPFLRCNIVKKSVDPPPLVMKLPFDDLAMLSMLPVLIVMLQPVRSSVNSFQRCLGFTQLLAVKRCSFEKRKLSTAL
eukprot:6491254-Amphidinium_carterae.1